jgi:hypothetical protein
MPFNRFILERLAETPPPESVETRKAKPAKKPRQQYPFG